MNDEDQAPEPHEVESELPISQWPAHPDAPPAGEADIVTDAEDPALNPNDSPFIRHPLLERDDE